GSKRGTFVDETVPHHAFFGVAGEERIVRELHSRRRRMSEPLLGHEGRAALAPLWNRKLADRLSVDAHGTRTGRKTFARKRRKQLVLAVAGDPCDTEDLAALYFKTDLVKPHPMRIIGFQGQVLDGEPRCRNRPS